MNGCVHSLIDVELQNPFVRDLCDVIGDLHDNVWSHAESPGVSLAQKWNAPGTRNREQIIEFALADCGRGFLSELQRAGLAQRLGIGDHQAAIGWCIEEGNSSKRRPAGDDWTQRLPEDYMGNPMGSFAGIIPSNNHLGLGLAKLVQCVRTYQGKLWITSGTHLLQINSDGTETYITNSRPWQGVAIACRFETVRLRSIAPPPSDPTVSLIEAVISRESTT